jgi:F-type H+-transporting ATPase subunit a
MLHISIAAEKLAEVVGIQITNSLLYTLVIFLVLVNFAFLVKFQINIIPSKLQSIAEMGVNMVYELVESIAGAYTREFFPWVMTFFIFILVSNWLGLVPGLSAIGVKEVVEGKEVIVPFFRAVTADLNTTLDLGLI